MAGATERKAGVADTAEILRAASIANGARTSGAPSFVAAMAVASSLPRMTLRRGTPHPLASAWTFGREARREYEFDHGVELLVDRQTWFDVPKRARLDVDVVDRDELGDVWVQVRMSTPRWQFETYSKHFRSFERGVDTFVLFADEHVDQVLRPDEDELDYDWLVRLEERAGRLRREHQQRENIREAAAKGYVNELSLSADRIAWTVLHYQPGASIPTKLREGELEGLTAKNFARALAELDPATPRVDLELRGARLASLSFELLLDGAGLVPTPTRIRRDDEPEREWTWSLSQHDGAEHTTGAVMAPSLEEALRRATVRAFGGYAVGPADERLDHQLVWDGDLAGRTVLTVTPMGSSAASAARSPVTVKKKAAKKKSAKKAGRR